MKKTLLLCLALGTATYTRGQAVTQNANMPSTVSILVLGVTNLSKSVDFYQKTLGLQVTSRQENIAMVSAGSLSLLLNETLGKAIKPGNGSMEIVFPVESVSAAHRLLTEKGCAFIRNPAQVTTDSWRAILTDPDGHMLTIFGGK